VHLRERAHSLTAFKTTFCRRERTHFNSKSSRKIEVAPTNVGDRATAHLARAVDERVAERHDRVRLRERARPVAHEAQLHVAQRVRAHLHGGRAKMSPPPLVLSGHAASLTPY